VSSYVTNPENRRVRAWDVTEEDLFPNGHIFATHSSTDSPRLNKSIMNPSSTAETESAEESPYSDHATTNTLFISERNGTSLMTAILIVTGVLSGCILVAGGIILVALVKKLRDSSNAPPHTNVYTPGASYP
jgi:hypothetical protein